MPAPTTLYDNDLAPIVTLPAGYFVMQNETVPPSGYIAVTYDDITGYVKTSDVKSVDYVPVNKYETTVTFTCDNDGQPVNLRAAPKKTASILTVLDGTTSGRCYGAVHGDSLIQSVGDCWYYVNANGTRGYCYSAHVTVTPTPPNIIEKEDPPEPNVPTTVDPTPEDQPTALPQYTAIIFIVVLCIPVPFIMFYLFKKPKTDDDDN